MSEHLKRALDRLHLSEMYRPAAPHLRQAIYHLIDHIKSQAAQTAESPAQPPTPSVSTSPSPNGLLLSASVIASLREWLQQCPLPTITAGFRLTVQHGRAILLSEDGAGILTTLTGTHVPLSTSGSVRDEPGVRGQVPEDADGAPGADAAGIPSQAGREHIGVVGKERLFPSPLTVPKAARDPEFVTEPENWALKVEIPPPNKPEGAASASSESSEFHRIRWPDGGFWTYASHDIDAFMARCETCDEMVTLRVTQPAAAPATPSVSERDAVTPAPSGKEWEAYECLARLPWCEFQFAHWHVATRTVGLRGAPFLTGNEDVISQVVALHNASIAAPEWDHRTRAAIAFIREVVRDARSSNFTDRANWGGRGQIILDAFAARPASAEEVGS